MAPRRHSRVNFAARQPRQFCGAAAAQHAASRSEGGGLAGTGQAGGGKNVGADAAWWATRLDPARAPAQPASALRARTQRTFMGTRRMHAPLLKRGRSVDLSERDGKEGRLPGEAASGPGGQGERSWEHDFDDAAARSPARGSERDGDCGRRWSDKVHIPLLFSHHAPRPHARTPILACLLQAPRSPCRTQTARRRRKSCQHATTPHTHARCAPRPRRLRALPHSHFA
jgi:hypothetical protein